MIAKSGARLLKPDAIEALKAKLLPNFFLWQGRPVTESRPYVAYALESARSPPRRVFSQLISPPFRRTSTWRFERP